MLVRAISVRAKVSQRVKLVTFAATMKRRPLLLKYPGNDPLNSAPRTQVLGTERVQIASCFLGTERVQLASFYLGTERVQTAF